MRSLRWVLVLWSFTPACVKAKPFPCTSGNQCVSGARTGICEPAGYCSFADPGCGSGKRYADHAGDGLGGQCVDEGPADGGADAASDGALDAAVDAARDGAVDGAADAATDAAPPDASGDGGPALSARLISASFYTDWNGATTFEYPPEMSHTGYSVRTAGVVDGDLLLFIGSVDNGSNMVWPNPVAPGFTQLAQNFYGNDGQSYVVAWKIAGGEPATYSASYGPGVGSSSAVIHLIAISGAKTTNPINDFRTQVGSGAGTDPVIATSTGVSPSVPGCLIVFAAGVDWQSAPGSNTFTAPSGYSVIAELGDRGDSTWDWTSQEIDTKLAAGTGATGPITGSFDGTQIGTAWTAVIAVNPR